MTRLDEGGLFEVDVRGLSRMDPSGRENVPDIFLYFVMPSGLMRAR
jgi:hypothetical protein